MNRLNKEMKVNIAQNPILFILFILITSLISILFSYFIIFSNVQKNAKENFNEVYNEKQLHVIKDIGNNDTFDSLFDNSKMNEVKMLYDEITSKYSMLIGIQQGFEGSYYEPLREFMLNHESKYALYYSMRLNQEYIQFHQINVEEGSLFKDENYKYVSGDTIPVLLGFNYKKFYQLKDTFYGNYMLFPPNSKFKVIGFLEKDTKVLNINESDYTSLDNFIILPSVILNNSNAYQSRMIMANYSQIIPSMIVSNKNEVVNIRNIIKKHGYESMYKVEHQNQIIEALFEIYNGISRFTIIGLIALFFFGFILILFSYLKRILMNSKRYAVHILAGASKNQIIQLILVDFVCILLLSNILTYFFLYLTKIMLSIQLYLYLKEIIITILLFDIFLYFSIYALISYKINKTEIGQFIRRIES